LNPLGSETGENFSPKITHSYYVTPSLLHVLPQEAN